MYDKDKTFHNTNTGARGSIGKEAMMGSSLDDSAIHALLVERERARMAKDFSQADKV